MLSVILINSRIYDRYLKYDYFFNWFEDNSNVSVCIWNKEITKEADIDELSPQLFDIVKNASEWNAYIIDEPFISRDHIEKDFENLTQYSINPYERSVNDPEYDPADDPLMRLVYFLGGRGFEQLQYINKYGFRAVRPNQIFLLTPRIFESLNMQKHILQSEIEKKNQNILSGPNALSDSIDAVSLIYSDFWNRYEYPANCRFLVFDMPDMLSVKYEDSWFLFWLAAMTLVINSYNSTELGPYKLHLLGIDLSSLSLEEFVNKFYMSLQNACDASKKDMENEVSAIKEAMEDTSSSHFAECAPVYVNFPDVDFGNFYAQNSDFGSTKDSPTLDVSVWNEHGKTAAEETSRMFKAVCRGKNEAVDSMNQTFAVDLPLLKNQHLSRYDAEDIRDELDKSELEMLNMKTDRFASRAAFEETEAQASKEVERDMVGRVYSKTYRRLTLLGVLVCLMGFIPFIVSSAKFSLSSCVASVLITLLACISVAAASFIALKWQRRKFKKTLDDYNEAITKNLQVVQEGAQLQSRYLSALLNYMQKYQMLISGKIEEHHMKRLEDLTRIHATYEDALDQCKSIAGLCRVKLVVDDTNVNVGRVIFMPGKKIYLHEETDDLQIPLNSTNDRLKPPFPFVEALHITEEPLFESAEYYNVRSAEQAEAVLVIDDTAKKGELTE